MIEFFQNVELLEEELLIRNESVHFVYMFTMGNYDNISIVRFLGAEHYDTKIIGGLVGTFHSFRELRKFDTINSIQLSYLRLLFVISEDYITVLAVDPEQTDPYYFKVIRILLNCLDIANSRSNDEDSKGDFEKLKGSIEMIFSLIYDGDQVEITHTATDREKIKESAKNELNKMLREIYRSHEKFFKRVST